MIFFRQNSHHHHWCIKWQSSIGESLEHWCIDLNLTSKSCSSLQLQKQRQTTLVIQKKRLPGELPQQPSGYIFSTQRWVWRRCCKGLPTNPTNNIDGAFVPCSVFMFNNFHRWSGWTHNKGMGNKVESWRLRFGWTWKECDLPKIHRVVCISKIL